MASLAQQLCRQSVLVVESTIPPGMTIDEWRRRRASERPSPPRRRVSKWRPRKKERS